MATSDRHIATLLVSASTLLDVRPSMRATCLTLLVWSCVVVAPAQDRLPLVESADTHYYDFWIGHWEVVKDNRADPSGTTFEVVRGVHPGALEETWRPAQLGAGGLAARGIRAWDKTAGRWMHVWVSDNGLFQVWEGRRVGRDWYMFHHFEIAGTRYLSRQAILPQGSDRAVRISERSDDGGQTWTLRFREELRRVKKAP